MANPNDYNNTLKSQIDYATQPSSVKMSPFDSLASAVDRLRELQKFASHLADRIAGAVPAQAGEKALGQVPAGGLIDGLELQTSLMRQIAQDINDSLSRIDNRI